MVLVFLFPFFLSFCVFRIVGFLDMLTDGFRPLVAFVVGLADDVAEEDGVDHQLEDRDEDAGEELGEDQQQDDEGHGLRHLCDGILGDGGFIHVGQPELNDGRA